jgi:hypothetical protein
MLSYAELLTLAFSALHPSLGSLERLARLCTREPVQGASSTSSVTTAADSKALGSRLRCSISVKAVVCPGSLAFSEHALGVDPLFENKTSSAKHDSWCPKLVLQQSVQQNHLKLEAALSVFRENFR